MKPAVFLRNLLSPPRCICCGEQLPFRAEILLCQDCRNKLIPTDGRVCRVCGLPLDTTYGELLCTACRKEPRQFIQNTSCYLYRNPIRTAILRMKFGKDQIWVARALGQLLLPAVQRAYRDIRFDAIVPVPLSRQHEKERGFNQSRELAVPVAKALKAPLLDDVLMKTKENESQSKLNKNQRKANVKGVYQVVLPEQILDKTVLLIDDTFTTGSTLNECAKTLRRAGAMAIYTATVAMVKPE